MAVNLSFIGGAGWQFLDNNGNPLSGGKIYTYAAGTVTPQATFTGRDGFTANTNPIILDAAGRTPAQIWSTEGVLYKYTVTTAADVSIRVWDNIGGSIVASDLADDLAAPSGSSLVGFLQAGTGAVATTVQAKLRESVSVLDFGAVGDGITDDYAAFRKCMDYCRINGRGHIFIPSGKYYISQELEMDFMGSISGERGLLFNQNPSGTVLRFPSGVNGIRICRAGTSTSGGLGDDSILEYFELVCVGDNRNSTGHGIVMDARASITGVSVIGFSEDGFHIEATASTSQRNANLWALTRCSAISNGRDGLFIDGADVNAGVGIGFNGSKNGRINIYDSSFLGNTHIGHHSSEPGIRAYGEGSDGKGYRCKLNHVSSEDTLPITGANWATYWELWSTGTSYPAIVSGTKYYDSRNGIVGEYPIYHYVADSANAQNVFVGCYAEGASGVVGGGSYIRDRSVITGGSIGRVEPDGYGNFAARLNVSPMQSVTKAPGTDVFVTTRTGGRSGSLGAYAYGASDSTATWALDYDSVGKVWNHRANGLGSTRSYLLCDAGNSLGRPPGFIDFITLGVGINGARQQALSALPSSGDYNRGDIVWKLLPSPSGKIGWVCTTAGVAGSTAVFKEFGAIDA
jgi:hypothetical protein